MIQEVKQMNNIEDLKIKGGKDKIPACELCIISKTHRQPFLNKYKHANSILNVIMFNLGYSKIISFGGAK